METISKSVGGRIRTYRLKRGFSQEYLAEKADLHPTYIGQLESGKKNASIITLEKLLCALGVTFTEFFEGLESKADTPSYATRCYELIYKRNSAEQARIYRILREIDQLMESSPP